MSNLKRQKSILSYDHCAVDKIMNDWHKEREKKGNIYRGYGEYIDFLEQRLDFEEDSYKRFLIEKEIKQLRKEQKKYYVPSILEMADFSLVHSRDNSKTSLEKASFSLVKKVRTKSRKSN